jgi:iron(III) transport system substrate-binding protein
MPVRRFALLLPVFGIIVIALGGCPRSSQSRVVVYCAQDEEFAKGLFGEFKDKSGLEVAPKYDTEAKKSVTHYAEIVSEKNRPRCDIFWNNEILGTIRLQRQGLLEPYNSPSAAPFAKGDKADDHTWCAFATRARVLIINTKVMRELDVKDADQPRSLLDLTQPRWKGKVVMAQPQYGTTATQAACLFEVLGTDKAKEYYRALKANGLQISPGNRHVAEWVGKGQTPAGQVVAVGVTDTDDAMEEVHDNHDVAIIFPDRETKEGRMGTLYIPNTVAIIKGCPNPEGARKLVDFLLSPEVEAKLAEGDSHQIPVNPNVKANLPAQYVKPSDKDARPMQVDFAKAVDLWNEVQTFLEAEFATQ